MVKFLPELLQHTRWKNYYYYHTSFSCVDTPQFILCLCSIFRVLKFLFLTISSNFIIAFWSEVLELLYHSGLFDGSYVPGEVVEWEFSKVLFDMLLWKSSSPLPSLESEGFNITQVLDFTWSGSQKVLGQENKGCWWEISSGDSPWDQYWLWMEKKWGQCWWPEGLKESRFWKWVWSKNGICLGVLSELEVIRNLGVRDWAWVVVDLKTQRSQLSAANLSS